MRKKLIAILLILTLALGMSMTLVGCKKDDVSEEKQTTIVFLGDSIAEAIDGTGPVTERENYGYYSVLGKRNNYKFYNRSVSGHKTGDMLKYISGEDKDARTHITLIKNADILHVSILGNDLLQNDMGAAILQMYNNDTSYIDGIVESATENIAAIVARLRELNPDAKLFFQNVYNPAWETAPIINDVMRARLDEAGVPATEYRPLAQQLLIRLNGVLDTYLAAHPDAFYLIDANSEFQRYFDISTAAGDALIFNDGVHPSNEGHAVLADLNQKKFEELGLADSATAVANYKTLRTEQLDRLFPNVADKATVQANIAAATTCTAVTKAFFDATRALTPAYGAARNYPLPTLQAGQSFVSAKTSFVINDKTTLDFALPDDPTINKIKPLICTPTGELKLSAILDVENASIILDTDGTFTMDLGLNPHLFDLVGAVVDIEDLLSALPAMLAEIDLQGLIDVYVEGIFPGFELGDLESTLGRIHNSLGLEIVGIDWDSANVKYLTDSLADTGRVPEDLVIRESTLRNFGIRYVGPYYLTTVHSDTMGDITCVYIGQHDSDSDPFLIGMLSTNAAGKQEFSMYVDFLRLGVGATAID